MTLPDDLDGQFETYQQTHPTIYPAFRKYALTMLERGFTHYGAKALMEVVRYHANIERGNGGDPFVINNNFTSRFARKLAQEDPRFAHFFEFRVLKSRGE